MNAEGEALLADIERQLAENPNDPRLWFAKGLFAAACGRAPMDSLLAFAKAIELNPAFAEAWHMMGLTFACAGEHQRAVEAYDQLLRIDAEHKLGWYNRAVSHAALGNAHQSVTDLKQAILLDSELREKARTDMDLDSLRNHGEFQNLIS